MAKNGIERQLMNERTNVSSTQRKHPALVGPDRKKTKLDRLEGEMTLPFIGSWQMGWKRA